MERKINLVLLVLIVLVCLLSYAKVPFIFFQQDEMLGIGGFIKEGASKIFSGLFSTGIKHFVPVTMSISYSIYSLFGMRFWIYNLFGLVFHLTNGVLVYLLAKRILKRKISSLIASLIFFSSSAATQLIMWPVINLNSIALTFSLVAWILVVDDKTLPKIKGFARGVFISLVFLMALFSVEYSIGLIFFIPLVLLFKYSRDIKKGGSILIPFIFTAITYLFLRFTPILHNQTSLVSLGNNTSFLTRFFNLVTGYFGQLIFDQSSLIFLIKEALRLLGLSGSGTVYVENYVFPLVSRVSGVVLILSSLVSYLILSKRSTRLAKNLLLLVLFIFFSSLPFLMVPGVPNFSSSISSRYLYFGLSGMSILIAFVIDLLLFYKRRLFLFLTLVGVSLMVFLGTIGNFVRGNYLYNQGVMRLDILNEIKASYPVLPDKAVFYFKSDMSYYGLSDNERILPFQSGLGQTLLVFYSQTEKFPMEFYPGKYLWEITSEGYMESGGRGFGFFRDFEQLKKAVKQYNIPKESVIAFSWLGITNKLEDTTVQIRRELTK